ncbi:hypothetical protein ACIBKX_25880 [Streptomyces sp. NPDC050658]
MTPPPPPRPLAAVAAGAIGSLWGVWWALLVGALFLIAPPILLLLSPV